MRHLWRQNIDGLVMNLASVIVFATLPDRHRQSPGAFHWRVRVTCMVSQPRSFRAVRVTLYWCHASLNSTMTSAIKQHPLFGFLPRNVTAKQVLPVIVRFVFLLFFTSCFSRRCRTAMKIRSLDCHIPLNITKFSRLEKSCLSLHRWRNFMKR